MKSFLAGVVLFVGISSHLNADILFLSDAISVKTDISKFHYTFYEKTLDNSELKKRGLMQCVELKELDGVLLCAAIKKSHMNQAFGRASLFSEGSAGVEKGQVFEQVLIPMSFKSQQFIAITYALDAVWSMALSHELKHAQYFLNPKYREITDRFWNETVSEVDRERIRTLLGQYYNRNDEAVLHNEFQAFLLEMRASENTLKDFVPLYRDKLIQKLQEAGLELMDSK